MLNLDKFFKNVCVFVYIPLILLYYGNMDDTLRQLWPGGLLYAGDPVGADPLALADFAGRVPARRGCDLGCGSGILMLLLARQRPELVIDGVELRPRAAEDCRRNIAANGLQDRCRVTVGDHRYIGPAPGSMDLVVCNPPYFPREACPPSPDPERALIRTETATLRELCVRAAELLRQGGAFCLIHRLDRMGEFFAALAAAGLEARRLRLVAAAPDRPPTLFLCEARRGVKPGIAMEPVLFQYGPDGRETAEYRRICHWEER